MIEFFHKHQREIIVGIISLILGFMACFLPTRYFVGKELENLEVTRIEHSLLIEYLMIDMFNKGKLEEAKIFMENELCSTILTFIGLKNKSDLSNVQISLLQKVYNVYMRIDKKRFLQTPKGMKHLNPTEQDSIRQLYQSVDEQLGEWLKTSKAP